MHDHAAVDSMGEDDEERRDSESGSNGELLSPEESDMILTKFIDPNTTLEERKNLGELLLDGVRRE